MAKFKNPWSHNNSPWYNQEKERWYGNQSQTSPKHQVVGRPKWIDVFEGYPKNMSGTDDLSTTEVFERVRGEEYDRKIFTNACATRVSFSVVEWKNAC